MGARRVLPGHLLRRSQVLSLLQIAPDKYLERVSVTGQSPSNFIPQSCSTLTLSHWSTWLSCEHT